MRRPTPIETKTAEAKKVGVRTLASNRRPAACADSRCSRTARMLASSRTSSSVCGVLAM